MAASAQSSGGIGVLGILGIVFIVLKLLDKIDWPWYLVLAPFWGPIALVAFIGGILLLGMGILALLKRILP